MSKIIGIALIAIALAGCSTLETKRGAETYRDRTKRQSEECVVRLMREGMDQRLIYPICRDIHQEKPLFVVPPRMGQ